MGNRTGEKAGWIGGWAGAFLWVLILSIMWFAKGRYLPAILGLLLVGLAAVMIVAFSPWRHPAAPYRRLLAPLYIPLALSVAWAAWAFGGVRQAGIQPWSVTLLLPLLLPLWTAGSRRWRDGGA